MVQLEQWWWEKKGVWFFALLIPLLVTSLSLSNLHLSNDFRVYFSDANPQLKAFERFEDTFSSHDSIAFIFHLPNEQSWLKKERLEWLQRVTKNAWQISTTTRVSSLSNYQYTYSEDDTLYTDYFYRYTSNVDQWRKALAQDPQLKESYLSSDESVTVIQADLSFDKNDNQTIRDIYQQVKAFEQNWSNDWSANFSELKLETHVVGSVISNITLETAVKNDLLTLVPITYLIIAIGLLIFIRSIKATIITLVIVSFSIIFTFSIFALFKQELTPIAGFVPSVILTLAVADCVHYLTSYRFLIEFEGKTPQQANRQAFAINVRPITITSITTAVGVLFLNLSDSPPYQDLGNMVAIGVMLALWLSLTLLPWLLSKFPIVFTKRAESSQYWLTNYSKRLTQHPKKFLLVISTLCLILSFGISKLVVSENWSRYFSDEFEIAHAIELLKEKFDRLHRYEVVLDGKANNVVNDPDYLQALDHLITWLEQQTDVKHIQSYGYLLKRLNQVLHNDNKAFFQMPESRQLAAQYLLLYELSLPEGLGLDAFANYNRSATRTSILMQPMDSQQLLDFEKRLFTEMESFPQYTVEVSGLDNIFAHIAHRNISQMIIGSAVALVVISMLIAIILRSLKLGIISVIPNLLPGVVAYGLWGLTAGYIDLALSVVICMSLGIIVDDTVHFLTKYHHARVKLGLDVESALSYSFQIVGRALITTTIILVAGFSTLLASPLVPTAATGTLLCITLIFALVIDFTLLPLALYLIEKKRKTLLN